MSTQLIIRLEPDLKERMTRLARSEGKSVSQVVRELIESYVREQDIASYIDDLWDRTGRKLRDRGVGPREIERAIRQSRTERS